MSNQQHYRTGQNLCSSVCPIDHIDIAGDKIKEPAGSWPDLRGLHSLNYSRDKWLTGDAIEVSIATYVRGLPKGLQDKIGLGIPGIRPEVWHAGPRGEENLFMVIKNNRSRRALNRMKATPFSIFPINTNSDHWVLVLMCKAPPRLVKKDANEKTEYSHVTHVAVLDPFRDTPRVNMVHDRLRRWLIEAGNFTYRENPQKTVWVPLQKDGTSCGPRAYWNAKQLIDRLLTFYEAGVDFSDVLWNDLSGWFNEHFVRGEMMGRCAWDAVRAMDYNARISVECVVRLREYENRNGKWEMADKLMKPADLSNLQPEKRPHTYRIVPIVTPPKTGKDRLPTQMDVDGPAAASTRSPPKQAKPPPPAGNEHKVAPKVKPSIPEVIVLDDSDGEGNRRGPSHANSSTRGNGGTPRPKGPKAGTPVVRGVSIPRIPGLRLSPRPAAPGPPRPGTGFGSLTGALPGPSSSEEKGSSSGGVKRGPSSAFDGPNKKPRRK
ncbi:hypothetical protein F4678DRAFT_469524 [Xylaria arbuscula]|nr:hypothetical protein F4678DRAFT_469524 [Xylaria arbuscula]